MGFALRAIKSMKRFFISSIVIILIAIGLSHLSTNGLGQNTLVAFIKQHSGFWLLVRGLIILCFAMIWPYIIKSLAKKQGWDNEMTAGMIKRRWRYVIWLIILDLVFQFL